MGPVTGGIGQDTAHEISNNKNRNLTTEKFRTSKNNRIQEFKQTLHPNKLIHTRNYPRDGGAT